MSDARTLLADLYAEAVAAVDPRRVLPRHSHIEGASWVFERDGRRVVLTPPARDAGARLRVIGIGKAADTLALGLLAALPTGFEIDDALIVCATPPAPGVLPAHWQLLAGEHPMPGERSLAAGRAVSAFADAARAGDRHLVLLTGGASALCVSPAPGVTLEQKIAATRALMHSGAPIAELNALRKRLSTLKGGQLAARIEARGATVATLAISDVQGDDLSVIGSGPTVRDAGTAIDAAVVATLDDALAAVVAAGVRRGLRVVSLGRTLYGEVAVHAAQLAVQLIGIARAGAPTLLVAGGEPVLQVTGDGLGGRAQELALRVAQGIAGLEGVTLLAAGTDGIDGPTTAAGGFADGGTRARIAAAGLDVERALARNDSHAALATAGDLFVTGTTGTNVADVVVAWVDGR
ncbi:MAG: glycerate kinase [Gammaproteobacteria bacterium]